MDSHENIPIISAPSLNRKTPYTEEEMSQYDSIFNDADVILDAISLSEGHYMILKGEEKLKEIVTTGEAQALKQIAVDAEFYQAWKQVRGNKS